MININFDNYEEVRAYIIRFLTHHINSKYRQPLGRTQHLINNGKSSQNLEFASIRALHNSKKIKYKFHTPMRFRYGKYFPVYAFLIMDMNPVMYAKYTIKTTTKEVFWLGWHPTTNPNDNRFRPLNYKEA